MHVRQYFQSYVGCALGIENIGFVMICYGVVDAVCSFTFGRLVQCVGHVPFFVLGIVLVYLYCLPLDSLEAQTQHNLSQACLAR